MNDKLVDFLIDKTDAFGNVINELAKQMGVAAKHIYGVMIKQQYVEGISGLLGCGLIFTIGLILLIISAKSRIRWLDKFEKREHVHDEDILITRWIGMIVGLAAMIITILVGMDYLKMLLNPEFYAIQEIMEMIRGEIEND